MNCTFKLLSLCLATAMAALAAGCSTGDDPADSTGTGGMSGTGGNAATGAQVLYGFDTDGEGFKLSDFKETEPYVNLGAPGASDPAPTLTWPSKNFDSAVTTSGSIKVEAKYSFWTQSVSVQVAGPINNQGEPVDLSASRVKAQLFVEKGLSPYTGMDGTGGVVFYIKSAGYVWGQAEWRNVEQNGVWATLTFNTENPYKDGDNGTKEGWDPKNPFEIGFQVSAGGGGGHCTDITMKGTDACPEWAAPLDTVFYIDNITVQKN